MSNGHQVFGIICMALASPAYIGSTHWFLFVAVTSFIATLLWTFVYLLGIREVLNLSVNWILTEFINTGISTLLYFIAMIVQLAAWTSLKGHSSRGSNIGAGVSIPDKCAIYIYAITLSNGFFLQCFGIFNTLAYAASCYLLYLEHRTTLPR